jgi:two-component system, NtrC family, response regulator
MRNILIIDDDKLICRALSKVVQRMGYDAVCSFTLQEGLVQLASKAFDVVFLDVRMPDGSGLDILPRIKETVFSPEIIIITGAGDPDGAELAIKSGAWDYIEKSSSLKAITLSLNRALKYIEQRKAPKPAVALNREGILGDSKKLRVCLDILAQAAQSSVNVLITGETGTGKELFARAIHLNSSRAKQDFVVLDCAALPETLVESILFGHQKGAFTGAHMPQEGLLKQADGGTLFLDEVGELPVSIQKTFLRVLQEHSFRPLGADKEVKSDFRLVAATNRDLSEMVGKKGFRKDLLYRLQTISIDLPPLRERPEDIREIAYYHINKGCKFLSINTKGFSEDFFQILSSYNWPGNVRELVNTMEWVLTKAHDEPILFPKHLPTKIRIPAARQRVSKQDEPHVDSAAGAASNSLLPKMREFLDDMRERYLKDLTLAAKGNVKRACEISGMSRAHLYQLLKKFNKTI